MEPFEPQWPEAPRHPVLTDQEVHVWRACLVLLPYQLQQLEQTLALEERQRCARLVFPKHRERFIASRGLLRMILGRYLGIAPDRLQFICGSYGKPSLSREYGAIEFNLSHSGSLCLYALARSQAVGIDLEQERDKFDIRSVASLCFSEREKSLFGTLLSCQDTFLNCWTGKEACLKATGRGLSLPMSNFDVLEADGGLVGRWRTPDGAEGSLRSLFVAEGYRAALACQSMDYRLQCWHLSV
jgi:4'-phosphopantetheinyl transferase